MHLLFRNPITAVAIGLYGLRWAFVFNWLGSGSTSYPDSCGAANGGLMLLTLLMLLITAVYVLVLAGLSLFSSGQKRKDYALFLSIVVAPAVYLLFS